MAMVRTSFAERWQSGRMQRFAKSSYVSKRTEGSNPSLSATYFKAPSRRGLSCLYERGIRTEASGSLLGRRGTLQATALPQAAWERKWASQSFESLANSLMGRDNLPYN